MLRFHRLVCAFFFVWQCHVARAHAGSPATTCLPDAIAPSQRQPLRHANGESYPLGLWISDWAAGYVTSAVIHILIEERLGYAVNETGPGPGALNAFYALAGCVDPMNLEDRGCGPQVTYNHINLETWGEGYTTEWEEIQREYPSMAPIDVGSMGYSGQTSLFMPKRSQQEAYDQLGTALDFFRGWNKSWSQPWHFFDGIADVSRGHIYPCNETRFTLTSPNELYLNITGDADGVRRLSENETIAFCPDGYFWLAPACRANTSHCVPYFTGGAGWMLDDVMQKAAAYNMPLAVAVAREYGVLPTKVTSTFYWWTPDPTFLDLDPVKIVFPEYDFNSYKVGDKRTALKDAFITKLVSQDLSTLAPRVEDLIRSVRFHVDDVNLMMMDMKQSGISHLEVACRWLKSNTGSWETWLPDKTKCFAGYGLYDISLMDFAFEREDPTYRECRPCTSGRYSSPLSDVKGTTYVCNPCEPGTSQPSFLALFCEPCQLGEHQNFSGSDNCNRCEIGKYQDRRGSALCDVCPPGSITLGLGSVSPSDCGCKAGFIDKGNLTCVECGEGLECPALATVASLQTGTAELGEDFVPYIRENFFSTVEQPLDLYRCLQPFRCSGGRPGSCSGGATNVACTDCRDGQTWDVDKCKDCSAFQVGGWILAFLVLCLGLPSLYYILTSQTTAKASVLFTTTCACGMTISMLQSVGIVGMMTVDFPLQIRGIFEFLQIFVLDIDNFAFSCVAGGRVSVRYVASVLCFPAAVLWLSACATLSKFLPKAYRWEPSKTKSTIGQVLQVGFSTMSSISMAPLTCFSHPNGIYSILKFPGVKCGSDQHIIMEVAGVMLLAVGVLGFLALCTWAVVMMPKWSGMGLHDRVRSFRFLVFRFRLDSWWFGVPLLMRGPLLSLPIALATDHPPVQIMCAILVLLVFLTVQSRSWPWKVPLLNLLDCLMSLCIALLVASSSLHLDAIQGSMQDFADMLSTVLMGALGVSLLLLVTMTCSALVFRATLGGQQELFLFNLQKMPTPAELSSQLRAVTASLSAMDEKDVVKPLGALPTYDINLLIASLSLLAMEVVPAAAGIESRVSFQSSRIDSSSFAPPKANVVELAEPKTADVSEDKHEESSWSPEPLQSFKEPVLQASI